MAPGCSRNAIWKEITLKPLDPNNSNSARQRIRRVFRHLKLASQQLKAAQDAAPSNHSRQRLQQLAIDLRLITEPLSLIASSLSRGGGR
jgi:hypothetical protein